MKIALVHDYLNQYGGAERVLEAFGEIFPSAPIYTLFYDPKKMKGCFSDKEIKTSFLQKMPFISSYHRIFPPLMPVAVEKLDLSGYDLVLSDSASFAKGVITKPETLHICYCHTPPRYAWDDSHNYIRNFNMPLIARPIVPFFVNYIRLWDKEASFRVDKFISNSKFVARRIKKYYNRDAKVIYPPVDLDDFKFRPEKGDYFLLVGRLVAYKRIDIAIKAFNKLRMPLKIIGGGRERKRLEKIAGDNIEFVGEVSRKEVEDYYRRCKALIFPQEEDFGIVALEAMACGKPVVAYGRGGVLESVEEGKTGIFFNEQNPKSLIDAIRSFDESRFDSNKIREHVLKFDKSIFKEKIKNFIKKEYENWRRY
ncbi:MAG: glycosyltransferase [Candidatus Portnoybacteria bacterium]|nr:glycosyltransferase [Candidatus Portnoybacteria bacterium]